MDVWGLWDAVAHDRLRYFSSAFKHGFTKEDIDTAIERRLAWWIVQEDPLKVFLLGFNKSQQILEIGIIDNDGEATVLHSMKARKIYLDRLKKADLL